MKKPPSDALRIALLQSSIDWHDAAANHARFDMLIESAPPSDIYILPEMFATAFTMEPAGVAETMDGPSVQWMQAHSRARQAALCGSLAIRHGDKFVNRFVFVTPDGAVQTYDKRHLFALAGENAAYVAGNQRVVLSYRGWNIVPQVCYDLRFPVWNRFATGCDLMIFVANWPRPRASTWRTLLRARSLENQCFVAGVNRVGRDQNDKRYVGDSALLGPDGETCIAAGDVTTALCATVTKSQLSRVRDRLPFYRDADEFDIRD